MRRCPVIAGRPASAGRRACTLWHAVHGRLGAEARARRRRAGAGGARVRGGRAVLVGGHAPGLDDLHARQPALPVAGRDHPGAPGPGGLAWRVRVRVAQGFVPGGAGARPPPCRTRRPPAPLPRCRAPGPGGPALFGSGGGPASWRRRVCARAGLQYSQVDGAAGVVATVPSQLDGGNGQVLPGGRACPVGSAS